MSGQGILVRAKRASKLLVFLSVVALLVVFSQVSVPLTVTQTFYPIPETARSRVMVTAINGASMTVPGNSMSEDGSTEPEPITFQTSNLTDNEALIQSNAAQVAGCNSEFGYNVNITFTTANELAEEIRGTANVTVYNNDNGKLLGSQLVVLDLKPSMPASATVNFYLFTPESDPIFRVCVSFPTNQELGPISTTLHLKLFEYFLFKGGIISAKGLAASG
jgi:hypothetical protein